jgi:hypothetical protein
LLFGQRDERLMPLSFDILVKSPASWLQPLSKHLGMKMDQWAARLVDNRSRARELKLANSHIADAVKRMEEQLAAVSQLP